MELSITPVLKLGGLGGKWYSSPQAAAGDDKKVNLRTVTQMMKKIAYALLILLYVYIYAFWVCFERLQPC